MIQDANNMYTNILLPKESVMSRDTKYRFNVFSTDEEYI